MEEAHFSPIDCLMAAVRAAQAGATPQVKTQLLALFEAAESAQSSLEVRDALAMALESALSELATPTHDLLVWQIELAQRQQDSITAAIVAIGRENDELRRELNRLRLVTDLRTLVDDRAAIVLDAISRLTEESRRKRVEVISQRQSLLRCFEA